MDWTWTWKAKGSECGLRLRAYVVDRWENELAGSSPYATFLRSQDSIPEPVLQEVIAALQSDHFNQWRAAQERQVREWVQAWSKVPSLEDSAVPRTHPLASASAEWNQASAAVKTRADAVVVRCEDGASLRVSHWDPLRLTTNDGREIEGPAITTAPVLAWRNVFFVVDPKQAHLFLIASNGAPLPGTLDRVTSHGFGVALRIADVLQYDNGLWARFYVAESGDHLPLAQLLGDEGLIQIDEQLRFLRRGRLR